MPAGSHGRGPARPPFVESPASRPTDCRTSRRSHSPCSEFLWCLGRVGGFGRVGAVGVVGAVGAVGAVGVVGEIGGWHGVCLCLFVLYVLEEENEDHSCRLNHQAKWLRVVLALEVLVSVFHRDSNFYPLNGQLLTYDCICQCCSYVEMIDGRFLLVVNLFVDLL